MKKMSMVLARCGLLAGALLATACYKHQYTVGKGGNVHSEPAYDSGWESHWFFGLIGGPELNVGKICPSGNATIQNEHSFLNSLVGAIIGAVWYPTSVTIYCDGTGAETAILIEPHTLRRIARDPRTALWAETVSPTGAEQLVDAVHQHEQQDTTVARSADRHIF